MSFGERERGGGETETETNRQTDRDRETERERQTDRQTELKLRFQTCGRRNVRCKSVWALLEIVHSWVSSVVRIPSYFCFREEDEEEVED